MPLTLPSWRIVDSEIGTGADHMQNDQACLSALENGSQTEPRLRLFSWNCPTVSYGYLLNESRVRQWASGHPIVKRPTGGGMVLHTEKDLSFSVAWRRADNLFSDAPRKCYAEIHERVRQALLSLSVPLSLKREGTSCATEDRVHVCFQEPVCNDILSGARKVVGGALRITRHAMLYQGTLQLPPEINVSAVELKPRIIQAFHHGNASF